MADVIINKPGVVAFGTGLPLPDGTDLTTFFQHETVVQIACGEDHSAVVCGSGRVYTFGLLGGDVDLEPIGPRLVECLTSVRINQAACGFRFTVFLSDKGHLYSSGVNTKGQLGLYHGNKMPIPALVTGLPTIKKVSAGYNHTVALTNSGEVWVAGSNQYGQLGIRHKKSYETIFTRVKNISESIIDISSGGYHTALISASQHLLICGFNKYGQLGLDHDKVKIRLSFTKRVSLPSTAAAAVSCGLYHTVALGVDGTAWAWGANVIGQLGTGDLDDRSTPTKMVGLEGKVISEVIAGRDQTAVLTRDGEVLMCGYGWNGELGLGKGSFTTPTLVPKSPGLMVKQVTFTRTYSLLLVVPKPDDNATLQLQIGSTDLERSIMKSLECPVCSKIMSRPIYLCNNGHSLCGTCRSDVRITACPVCRGHFIVTRNISLEDVSDNLKLPLG